MNKKTLILIFFSIPLVHTNAMELLPVKRKRAASQPNPQSHAPQKNKKSYIEPSLSAILKQKIFTISSLCSTYPYLRDAAITVNALVQVNEFLNAFINDDERTLQLIKQLSDRFGDSNIEVAHRLCTKSGHHRVDRQMAFFVGWDSPSFNDIERNMNRLKRIGFDLDFTYNNQQPTALIQATTMRGTASAVHQARKIALWLIVNGADINILTSCKQSAAMLALMSNDLAFMHMFLDHQNFKVNHHDMEKHTPLHYCFYDKRAFGGNQQMEKSRAQHIYEIVKKLLEKGANPIAESDDGKTPLMLARESGHQPLIDLLEKAAVEFKSIENKIRL